MNDKYFFTSATLKTLIVGKIKGHKLFAMIKRKVARVYYGNVPLGTFKTNIFISFLSAVVEMFLFQVY